MEKNIWTGIEPANVELPIQVINEYANSFNETFEGKMTMTVKSKIDDSIVVTVESLLNPEKKSENGRYEINVSIDVPSLKGYSLKVIVVSYDVIKIYPCAIKNLLDGSTEECPDEETFKVKIKALFASDDFTQILKNLLVQVR